MREVSEVEFQFPPPFVDDLSALVTTTLVTLRNGEVPRQAVLAWRGTQRIGACFLARHSREEKDDVYSAVAGWLASERADLLGVAADGSVSLRRYDDPDLDTVVPSEDPDAFSAVYALSYAAVDGGLVCGPAAASRYTIGDNGECVVFAPGVVESSVPAGETAVLAAGLLRLVRPRTRGSLEREGHWFL